MNPHTTLNLAKIALCAVETVLRNTSPGAEDYSPSWLNKNNNADKCLQMQENSMMPQADAAAIKRTSPTNKKVK